MKKANGLNTKKQNDMTETITIDRTYYIDLTEHNLGIHADVESMVAFLLDESILFVGNDYGDGTINLSSTSTITLRLLLMLKIYQHVTLQSFLKCIAEMGMMV